MVEANNEIADVTAVTGTDSIQGTHLVRGIDLLCSQEGGTVYGTLSFQVTSETVNQSVTVVCICAQKCEVNTDEVITLIELPVQRLWELEATEITMNNLLQKNVFQQTTSMYGH